MDNESAAESVVSKLVSERVGKSISAEKQEYFRLQKEYEQRFGEQLVFSVVGHEEKSHIEILKECLRTGRPYKHQDTPEDCKI